MTTLADIVGRNEQAWMAQGACQRANNPELFFPDRGRSDLEREAKRICADCPVIQECLADALTHSLQFGIRGKTTATERRRILRAQRKTTVSPACGTPYGANGHYKRGETPCAACRAVDNARRTEQRRKREAAVPCTKPPTPTGKCGTEAGAKRHSRRGEISCDLCKQARADADASRSVARRTQISA